jgi:hypothetical protein
MTLISERREYTLIKLNYALSKSKDALLRFEVM